MLILGIAACGDMYDVHEKYLKMGEETYLGIASDLEANSGFNRIELKWKLNADPRINASIISWEGCETPIEVPISADRDVNDYISKIIDLSEGKYIFSIINKSETGKESLIQTISGEVYGGSYQAGLSAQGINSMQRHCRKELPLNGLLWKDVQKRCLLIPATKAAKKQSL